MAFLATWDKVPKEQLLAVFERGNFAGVEEMRTNERLFNRVAPMGVNDIAMACQYKFTPVPALDIPVTSFEGLADNTIDAGAASLLSTHVLSQTNVACAVLVRRSPQVEWPHMTSVHQAHDL